MNNNIAIQKLQAAVDAALNGTVWYPSVERLRKSIKYEFLYPNGKNGDIDMFIANKYGEVQQVSSLKYQVTIPVKYRDQIALMNSSNMSHFGPRQCEDVQLNRNEINNFLLRYNLCISLAQLNSIALECGMSINYPLRKQAEDIRVAYLGHLRDERRKLYADMVSMGNITTSRWKSEQQAYTIVKTQYADAIYQYTADWLGQQSLDIYIPSIHIAVEYQGVQHFEPVRGFGGEEGLSKRLALDKKKRALCEKNGIRLVEWRYDEPLTEDTIIQKITDALNNDLITGKNRN